MKKLKNESALFKEALLAGVKYAEGRGVVEFEATDSASEKLLYIYRLLVHDKIIQPLNCYTSTGSWYTIKSFNLYRKTKLPKNPCDINLQSGIQNNYLKIILF